MNKGCKYLIAFSVLAWASQAAAWPAPGAMYEASNACTLNEAWKPSASFPKAWAPLVAKFLSPKTGALSDYNTAFLLRERVRTSEGQALGQYWMARSLYRMGFIHLAYEGFGMTFATQNAPETLGVRMAALECLNRINRDFANMPIQKEAALKLFEIPIGSLNPASREIVQEAAFVLVKNGLADSMGADGRQRAFALLQGSGSFESLARAMLYVQDFDFPNAIIQFKSFFSASDSKPAFVRNFEDSAHLLLARSYYELKYYDQALEEFKKIPRESNYLPQSLSDTAWAYLRKTKYNEAVGTALSLQTGGLARTFAPEAPVIVAISLVELCHYPEALKQLKVFTKSYFPSYKWLHEWTTAQRPLYDFALEFVKRKPGIPSKVGTEWLRNPVFLTNQKEINLLNDETRAGNVALSRIRAIPRLQTAPNYKGYFYLQSELSRLIGQAPGRQSQLVASINNSLSETNRRLINDIAESAENAQLVEVEVYNSAGEDMIKKNARADAYTGARKIAQAEKGGIWRWGKLPTNLDERVEVWDDELGFLKGDLTDQCPKSSGK